MDGDMLINKYDRKERRYLFQAENNFYFSYDVLDTLSSNYKKKHLDY